MHRRLRFGRLHHRAFLVYLIAAAVLVSPAQNTVESIRVDVQLVNLNVSVMDRNDRPYSRLAASDFRIYDNGIEQAIQHFSADDLPYSMGLVLDRSGSMSGMIQEVYDAAFHTVRASKTEDEFFIELFNDKIEMRQEFTTDQRVLEQQLQGVAAYESTALYDAILTGLDHVKNGHHDKKVLLVVTDGADNSSKHSFQEVLQRARSDGVAIYVVGMFDERGLAAEGSHEEALRALLSQLADATGGRSYFPTTVKECEHACIAIAQELRQQYSLGYYPRPKLLDGSWRSVQVQLSLPEGLYNKGLTTRTRSGYYAPRQ